MQLIRDLSGKDYCFVNDKKQCVLKVSKSAIPCFNTDKCFYFLFHDAVIKVEFSKNDAVYPSLNLYVNKRMVLHFSDETPENEACLSVYDKLPAIVSVASGKEILNNKWQFIDYRDEKDIPKRAVRRDSKAKQPQKVRHKEGKISKNNDFFCRGSVYKMASWPKIKLSGSSDWCFENERG
ncbi:MAG: hypothetical protein IKY98_02615 [Alphaproteobacteria bacterium]|nr:hypothetical protein [Alphaproteobacteria bacterium]